MQDVSSLSNFMYHTSFLFSILFICTQREGKLIYSNSVKTWFQGLTKYKSDRFFGGAFCMWQKDIWFYRALDPLPWRPTLRERFVPRKSRPQNASRKRKADHKEGGEKEGQETPKSVKKGRKNEAKTAKKKSVRKDEEELEWTDSASENKEEVEWEEEEKGQGRSRGRGRGR